MCYMLHYKDTADIRITKYVSGCRRSFNLSQPNTMQISAVYGYTWHNGSGQESRASRWQKSPWKTHCWMLESGLCWTDNNNVQLVESILSEMSLVDTDVSVSQDDHSEKPFPRWQSTLEDSISNFLVTPRFVICQISWMHVAFNRER